MPTFDQEIDVDDFLYECSRYEIRQIIEYLEENGYIKENSAIKSDVAGEPNTEPSNWSDMITKIRENKHQLSPGDELTIINIFNKLI